MESAASLAELQAEANCPICLDYLRDPVTIECGHTFCHSCIHQRWEDLPGTFPCPVCLHHCPDRNLKRNTQLCHMIEIVKQIPISGSQRKLQEEKPLCGKHNEVVTLFCDRAQEMLCPHCRAQEMCPDCKVPLEHQDQSLMPIEEAAASNRRKLKRYIGALMMELEEAETEYEKQIAKEFEVQKKMEKWRKELQYECKELKCSLQIEHDLFNAGLLIEEKDVEEKLTENRRQISNHMFMLNNLLSEVAEKYLQADVDLLTGIGDIHNRYEKLETPAVFSYKLKKESCYLPPHYLGLYKIISTFQVDLTLDPETAHPSLVISRDRKSVTYKTPDGLPNSQALTSYPAVLSCEGFDAGRHFWQVEIRGTGEWSLGVCKESCLINSLISPSPSNSCRHIDLCASICGTCPRGHIMRVGIFLDYELGDVSFYNLNNGSYLYGFTGKFREKLMPYFSSAPSSKSLTFIIRDE